MITPENDQDVVVSYKSLYYCGTCGKKDVIWTINPTNDLPNGYTGEIYTSECSESKHQQRFLMWRLYGQYNSYNFFVPYEIMDKKTFYEKFIKGKIKRYNLF